MNEDVVEYIRANRGTYTREAIDARLRRQGHSEEDIEAAWKVVRDDDAEETAQASIKKEGTGPPQETASSLATGCFRAVLFILIALVGVVVLGLANLGLGYGSRVPLQWFVNLGTVLLFVGLVVLGSWLSNAKSWSGGRIATLIIALVLIWYLIVSGTCLIGVTNVYG